MSNRKKQQAHPDLSLIEVKSKFEAEFRRFSLKRDAYKDFEEFKDLLERTHCLENIPFSIYYRHPQHGLLPINNSENFVFALGTAVPLLRLFLQRGDIPQTINGVGTNKKHLGFGSYMPVVNKRLQISVPQDFRCVSQIIDVDILPESVRRVRLCKHNSNKPLGFYIRDGTSLRVTTEGISRVSGIFVSRLVPDGLAERSGLLSVNDEVLEVNGIEVAEKSLDQVTEMMVANSQNLIVTVKPVHPSSNKASVPVISSADPLDIKPPTDMTKNPLTVDSTPHLPNSSMEPVDSDEDEEPVIKDGVFHV